MNRSSATTLLVVAALAIPVYSVRLAAQDINGTVIDSLSGKPVYFVRVVLNDVDSVTTEPDGTFKISDPDWRPDDNTLEFRRLGYRPQTLSVTPVSGADVALNVVLWPLAIHMTEVTVDGVRITVPAKLEGFYRRREFEWGDFLTAEDIEKLNAIDVPEILARAKHVNVLYSSWAGMGPTARIPRMGTFCTPKFYLDGLPFPMDALSEISAYDVAGMEIYSGPARVPVQLNMTGSACGVIAIWTK